MRIAPRLQAYSTPERLAVAAPGVFVLLWSTGFVGARWALPYAEPFTFLALRLGLATLLMGGLARATRATWPEPRDGVRIAICGVLLHATYLGGVFWGISRGMPAGMAALIVGLQPVLTAVIAPLALNEAVVGRQWLGLALGFGGVGLVVGEQVLAINLRAIPPTAFFSTGVALVGGTLGTLYQRRLSTKMQLASGTAIQYAASSVVLLACASLFETMQLQWTPALVGALVWLTLVLSIGAISLLLFLLRTNAAAQVSSLFFLVPPCTALWAFLLFNERLGLVALLGMAVAVAGVALVVRAPHPAA